MRAEMVVSAFAEHGLLSIIDSDLVADGVTAAELPAHTRGQEAVAGGKDATRIA